MKKMLYALCLLMLCLVSTAAYAEADTVRVGLKYAGSAVTKGVFSGSGGLSFCDADTGQALYTSSSGEKVTVEKEGKGFSGDGKFAAAETVRLAVKSQDNSPINYDGSDYRGSFLLDVSGGNITVINIVHMDQYLYSVLGREMSASFPAEALKAQAICAKNFVYGETDRHSTQGFDVCATTHCQVYSGVIGESPETIAAVDAVSGKAAYYDGKIVPLYFFATSGGMTESVENVWGMEVPYLVSVDDPYEPADKASKYTWTTVLTGGEIKDILSQSGVDIGNITSISVDEVSDSGRVLKMTFVGTDGTKTVVREACRSILGTSRIFSQCFTVSGGGDTVVGKTALTASGTKTVTGSSAITADGVIRLAASSGDSFTFSGKGYGHGVGMSQWGAYGMAKQGYTYEEILQHYFTGINIK